MYLSFEEIILKLHHYWTDQGCFLSQPYDQETGAGTFNPATFFGVLGPQEHRVCYVEPSRRPADGRYGENPNRLYQHHQYQVILKPAPTNGQELYLNSLRALGLVLEDHDVRFSEDDWESPTLGATGLGWEVCLDGMEITQFTYFQSVGGFELDPPSLELTYGLERIAMYLQKKEDIYNIFCNKKNLLYGDLYKFPEFEFSKYSFEVADIDFHFLLFDKYEEECYSILKEGLVRPAYDMVLKASHVFNVLDARNAISVTERVNYISRVRKMACGCAKLYMEKVSS
ncbi:glycine--tRNA ligase subunit alpha [PVC group bacterium (ex Bugula neritina AB1)]|nr:glycine--tRNA ligase subunit alpha [PVC group bacterium (ex Bugula neritina AB1)]